MVYSMTAFARSEQSTQQGSLVWELRSVNHRYLEASLRLPEAFRDLEGPVRDALRKGLSRGKVECTLRFTEDSTGRALQVDSQRASQALDRLPGGPVNIDDWKIVLPEKAAVYTQMESLITHFKLIMKGHGLKTPRRGKLYSATESPNGELGWYIETDGTAVGYRVRCRPPSYINYSAMPQMVKGGYLADVVACLSSLNVIAGELDR